MSALTSPTGPTNTTTIPLVTPQPAAATPIATSIPASPVGASTAPAVVDPTTGQPLTAAQTLYDTTVQGDVDPTSLLPPDFDVEAWAPSLYAHEEDMGDDCYADDYTVQQFGPSYYASGGEGDFEILPWAWGTGPKSYYSNAKRNNIIDLDIKVPVIALAGVGLLVAAIWYWRKRR